MLGNGRFIIAYIVPQKEATMNHYGYARVSTREQDLSGQVAELTAAGCAKVFREKASGARGDRGQAA